MILRAHSKKREARQVLIELSYRLNFREKSLMQLGDELGGVGGDSIAHTHKRIQKKVKEDKKLSRRVNRIYKEIISP
jgi:chromosomal replication initiation ATPase DnaA